MNDDNSYLIDNTNSLLALFIWTAVHPTGSEGIVKNKLRSLKVQTMF
jgi:hypothetical protein